MPSPEGRQAGRVSEDSGNFGMKLSDAGSTGTGHPLLPSLAWAHHLPWEWGAPGSCAHTGTCSRLEIPREPWLVHKLLATSLVHSCTSGLSLSHSRDLLLLCYPVLAQTLE